MTTPLAAETYRPTLLSRGLLFLVTYTVAFFASKYQGFSIGYALDDYAVSHPSADGLAGFFLSQGRYTNAALDVLLNSSGLNMTSFSVIALLGTLAFSGLFYLEVLRPRHDTPAPMVAAVAALLGAHSYYAEYVTFRQSALPMSIMFAMLYFAIRQYRIARSADSASWGRLAIAFLAGVVAMGANQLALCYATIAVLFIELSAISTDIDFGRVRGKSLVKAVGLVMATGLALVVGNLVVASLGRMITGIAADSRATFISIEAVPERARQLLELMPTLLVKAEPIAAAPVKALLLLGLFVAVLPMRSKRIRVSLFALLFGLTAWSIALLPHAVSGTWWPVPRTLVAIPFALAGMLALSTQLERNQARVSALLVLTAAVLFSAHSNAMLQNQQRVNRWDIAQAQEIAYRVAERYPQMHGKLAIVGGKWAYPVAPLAAQGDMNLSALSVGWAIDPLFDEATGTDLTVRAAPELAETCSGRAAFPSLESTIETADEIIVCL